MVQYIFLTPGEGLPFTTGTMGVDSVKELLEKGRKQAEKRRAAIDVRFDLAICAIQAPYCADTAKIISGSANMRRVSELALNEQELGSLTLAYAGAPLRNYLNDVRTSMLMKKASAGWQEVQKLVKRYKARSVLVVASGPMIAAVLYQLAPKDSELGEMFALTAIGDCEGYRFEIASKKSGLSNIIMLIDDLA